MDQSATVRPADPSPHRPVRWLLLAACAACFGLYAVTLLRPVLVIDDFQILVRSWTWQKTWDNLWVPANEHAMPIGRITTWLLVVLAGRLSAVPYLCGLQGPLALLAGLLLTFVFVRREFASPAHGLLAAILFGVSTTYQQAVPWFSASFSILTLDSLLLGLLAAQAWRQRGGVLPAVLCAAATALAPCWFASGVLAGPLCALYLFPPERESKTPLWAQLLLRPLVPLAGTALFLAVSLPRTARHIMHLEHYGGADAVRSFLPWTGLGRTFRSIVENLLLGQFGVWSITVPIPLVALVAVALGVALLIVARRAPQARRLLLLGVGLVVASYWLTYSARGTWPYEGKMNQLNWSRYHLLPQLGLALIVASAVTLPWPPRPTLSPRQVRRLALLIGLLFLLHLPRGIGAGWGIEHRPQQAVLRHIEEVDARCHQHGISAETARAVLGELEIPSAFGRENGWEFLRGSPRPDPSITPDQARKLLLPGP